MSIHAYPDLVSCPVLTLCVYWGEQEWDGPKNLHEMLDIPPDFLRYKAKIADYKLNLLEVCRIPNLDQYQGELKALLGFVRYQKNKRALQQFITENQKIFQNIGRETLHAMSILGNTRNLEDDLIRKQADQTEAELDMCQALKEWLEDERAEGRAAGLGVQLVSGSIFQLGKNNSAREVLDFCVPENMPATRKCVAAYSRDNVKKHLIRDVIRIVRQEVLVNCELVQVVSPDDQK